MNTMPSEILINIIKLSSNIHDWLNFMYVAKDIHEKIYSTFLTQKFKFMVLYGQKIPPCSINNHKIKYIGSNNHKIRMAEQAFITTDINHIRGHCQFSGFGIFETFGLFFFRLSFSTGLPQQRELLKC